MKLLKPTVWNGKRVAVDGGHGADTSGKCTPYIRSLGRRIREHEFNEPVQNFLADELLAHGFEVLLVAPGEYDVPLERRTYLANLYECDIYVSIHFNAYDGSFDGPNPNGISVHIYDGPLNSRTEELAECVAKYLKKGTKQNFRGIKRHNFHVLRETNMSAILTENGFMDYRREALLMLDTDFQREVAIEHAKGICEFFDMKYEEVDRVFRDVPKNHWAEGVIKQAKELDLMNGINKKDFGLGQNVKREELAAVVVRQHNQFEERIEQLKNELKEDK